MRANAMTYWELSEWIGTRFAWWVPFCIGLVISAAFYLTEWARKRKS